MEKPVLRAVATLLFVWASSCASVAGDVAKPEELLRRAMSYDAKTKARQLETGTAIRAYIKAGYVKRKPDYSVDYNDLRKVLKPATLFGHKLTVLMEEYMSQYIGCCVSPGIGVVIEQKGDMTELESFLTSNKCSIATTASPEGNFGGLNIPSKPGAAYFEISCRERDIQDE
jgi:hypothetical protein